MKIKRQDYFALVGLLTIAKQHRDALDEIEKAVMKLVGESEEDYHQGHSGDAVWAGDISAVDLLKKVNARKGK